VFNIQSSYVRLKFALDPPYLQGFTMLQLLRIQNFALIRELVVEFSQGLNLLTGETGSGKSILVDALGLLLGTRSSQEMIRSDCDSAIVEGIFELEPNAPAWQILAQAGFETDESSLIIRREIASSGRNRVLVNNHLATLSLLKAIGEELADIHGQQDQRSLLDLSTHLDWLDYFGRNASSLREVRNCYGKVREIAESIKSLETDEKERLQRMDMLQFQIDEIHHVNPQLNEREELDQERMLLSNYEKILALATEAYSLVYDSESSISQQSIRLERILEELERFDKAWEVHREAVQESRYKLEDLAYKAREYAALSEFSPERLEQVHQRLYALDRLTKKYGSSIPDVIKHLEQCLRELEELRSRTDSRSGLSEQFNQEFNRYRECADRLSRKRQADASRLEDEIRKEFAALAMERMEMKVQIDPCATNDTKELFPAFYGLKGIDNVEFLIAPNKGEEMMPLAKIASGGELSRLMLSIRSLCGNEEAGKTFVFDEVDSGIGGRVAEAVGRRLRDISKANQVLCVTHLPQIAAFASEHFNVRKEVVGNRTETIIKRLNALERVDELSRMLGGENITKTTQRHAQELLEYSTGLGKKL
jgi:DNA repair protein RecN (Recombination protein N)